MAESAFFLESTYEEAYEAGYADGQERTLDNVDDWVKK